MGISTNAASEDLYSIPSECLGELHDYHQNLQKGRVASWELHCSHPWGDLSLSTLKRATSMHNRKAYTQIQKAEN
jgi:hypothetical protein